MVKFKDTHCCLQQIKVHGEVAQEDKPILSKTSKLVGASGVTINELGKGTFIWKWDR